MSTDLSLYCSNPPLLFTPCSGSWHMDNHGFKFVPFVGSVTGRTRDGIARPVAHATFLTMDSSVVTYPFSTNRKGRFKGKVMVSTYEIRYCRNGVVEGDGGARTPKIVVRAENCQDAQIELSSELDTHSIELSCDQSDGLSNNRLKPPDPRVTPLAEERKRRATRPAA